MRFHATLLVAGFCLVALAVGPASAPPALADPATAITFVDSGQRLGQGVSFGPSFGDLDSDSDLDLFTAHHTATNAVWLNDGSARFTPVDSLFGSGVATAETGDVDSDCDGDLGVFVSRDTGYGPAPIYFNTTPSAGVGDHGAVPARHLLGQNTPNPFGPITEICYSVPAAGHAGLKLFDVRGRELRTLAAGFHPAGLYTISLDGTDLPGGTYFCRFEARNGRGDNVIETRKMVRVR
jgi:hypothetical protein